MHMMKKLLLRCAAALCLGAVAVAPAAAQDYPNRPLRLIVPFPPGGPADILGRLIAQEMSTGLGKQVIVENRGGGNTVIGAEVVAKAPPDGYTLLLAIDATLSMNAALYNKLPYDPVKDFAPVALVARIPSVVVAGSASGITSLQDLIDKARAAPDKFSLGTGAVATQLSGQLLMNRTNTRMVNVPYKGGSLTINALLAGEVPVIVDGIASTLPQWRAGKVKVLAVTSGTRAPQMPDIPTVAEAANLPGFDTAVWQSVVVPAGTPREIVMRLNTELGRVMQVPSVRETLFGLGIQPQHGTPEELAAYVRSETARWSVMIKEIGLKIE
jgi:tripartite-type tricarboxylate transporter receptor subunit TctC